MKNTLHKKLLVKKARVIDTSYLEKLKQDLELPKNVNLVLGSHSGLTFVLSSSLFFCSAMSMTPLRARATSGQRVECWKYIEPVPCGAGGGGDPRNFLFSAVGAALEYGRARWSWDLE